MPTEQAALSTWNQGSTTPIIRSNPPPSGPSRASAGTETPSAAMGREALPRRPRPSKGPATRSPPVSAGTSHSVLAPSAATGRLDHTYESASPAAVTQLLLASSRTVVPLAAAVLSGAHN